MESKKTVKYLFNVFMFLGAQDHIYCLFLTRTPCCGRVLLPTYSKLNAFSINQLPNPLLLGFEPAILTSEQNEGKITPSPLSNIEEINPEAAKAYTCSLLPCLDEVVETPVCACNYNTGNVVTFKNICDVKKHNCRFDTAFKVILNEICPWEFKSRRTNTDIEIDYDNPKYYN